MAEITKKDRAILRDLAKRVRDIAALPVMEERRGLWKQHHALCRPRAMILVFPEGSWRELLPEAALTCEGKQARGMEMNLRCRIYAQEHFAGDAVMEAEWVAGPLVRSSGWGLEPRRKPSPDSAMGAWAFEPVILDPGDLKKLRHPDLWVDEEATRRGREIAHDLFGGILRVREKGGCHVSFHLMNEYTSLRGLNQVMMDMYDNPGMLAEAMAFLEEGHRRRIRQMLALGVLALNNDGTYQSTGGVGYTDELPKPGYDGEHVRLCDLWASAEAQELALVSPEMHERFCLQYERRLLEPFGLNGYGCCEDLTRKLDHVLRIPNIRRISIAPSADVAKCAERLGRQAIFSWKPKPQMLVGGFDPKAIRQYLREALEATRGCVFEMILKDTHTCENRPERFDTWVRLAREEVERLGE
ncbi:MAG: hypothetical protein WBD63_02260 [Phycisphaerae bacterium]|nr:hypothetical protein [Phycisphaerae bacterium]